MKKLKIHPKVWQAAEDAIADKNGYLVHWPNRAETWWKRIPKIIYWKFKVFRGYKASSYAPRVIRDKEGTIVIRTDQDRWNELKNYLIKPR